MTTADNAKMVANAPVNAFAAVLGPPEPRGLGWASLALIVAGSATAAGYEWLADEAGQWLTP